MPRATASGASATSAAARRTRMKSNLYWICGELKLAASSYLVMSRSRTSLTFSPNRQTFRSNLIVLPSTLRSTRTCSTAKMAKDYPSRRGLRRILHHPARVSPTMWQQNIESAHFRWMSTGFRPRRKQKNSDRAVDRAADDFIAYQCAFRKLRRSSTALKPQLVFPLSE